MLGELHIAEWFQTFLKRQKEGSLSVLISFHLSFLFVFQSIPGGAQVFLLVRDHLWRGSETQGVPVIETGLAACEACTLTTVLSSPVIISPFHICSWDLVVEGNVKAP